MLSTILKHKSIRKYKDIPIESDILKNILLAASKGSNTGNMQLYSIIVTQDQKIKEELLPTKKKKKMIIEAPIVLTFCADINRFNKWCELRNAKPAYNNLLWLYTATIDTIIAAQNACIAAEHYNLGICYLGTTNYTAEKISEILELPKGVIPVTTIVLGYPENQSELTDRLPIEAVVHYNKYKDYENTDIEKYFAEKENLELTKKLIEENKTENLAQIFTDKRYKKEDNLHFSKTFLEYIKKQGFEI